VGSAPPDKNQSLFTIFIRGGKLPTIKHITNYWDRFEDFLANRVQGIKTGFPGLDSAVLGLPGLTVVQGEPKSNKSTFCLQVALNHAKHYGPVIYYDAENGVSRLLWRLGCLINGCSSTEYSKAESKDLRLQTKEFLEKHPFTIIEEDGGQIDNLYLEEMVATVYEKHPKKKILLVLDSVQALPVLHENKRYSIDTWLQSIEAVKKNYQGYLTILVTSEKSKSMYKEAVVGGSKDSGGIEYKAELLLDMQAPTADRASCLLTIAAGRDIPKGEQIFLAPKLANLKDPHSFTFTLEEEEKYGF